MQDSKSVTVHYWASAKAAAGVAEEVVELPADAKLGELTDVIRGRHGAELDRVIAVCSVLVDGIQAGTAQPETVALPDGARVEFLPPFAGG